MFVNIKQKKVVSEKANKSIKVKEYKYNIITTIKNGMKILNDDIYMDQKKLRNK